MWPFNKRSADLPCFTTGSAFTGGSSFTGVGGGGERVAGAGSDDFLGLRKLCCSVSWFLGTASEPGFFCLLWKNVI